MVARQVITKNEHSKASWLAEDLQEATRAGTIKSAPHLVQFTVRALYPKRVAAPGDLIRVEGISKLSERQHRQGQQVSTGVVTSALSFTAVRSGSRCLDCEAMTIIQPPSTILTELLQQQRSAV